MKMKDQVGTYDNEDLAMKDDPRSDNDIATFIGSYLINLTIKKMSHNLSGKQPNFAALLKYKKLVLIWSKSNTLLKNVTY